MRHHHHHHALITIATAAFRAGARRTIWRHERPRCGVASRMSRAIERMAR
jgi:hypothetical protein